MDCFARCIHRFDVLLESLRRGSGAESTIAVYHNRPAVYACPSDTGDESSGLDSLRADVDGVELGSKPFVTYIDIVIARGEIVTGVIAQRNVETPRGVVKQRIIAVSRITRS